MGKSWTNLRGFAHSPSTHLSGAAEPPTCGARAREGLVAWGLTAWDFMKSATHSFTGKLVREGNGGGGVVQKTDPSPRRHVPAMVANARSQVTCCEDFHANGQQAHEKMLTVASR